MQTPSPRFRPVDSVEATDFLEPQRKANSEFAVLNNSFKTDAICCDRCGKWRPWPANLPGILMGQNDDDDKEDEGKEEEKDEDDDDDDDDDDEDDEEPWFCSMHDDPRYASCGALVHRIREGPEFQMTWLPPADMQAPIIERADVLLQIDLLDVPQSRPRNRGANTAHRGRGRAKGKKYAAGAGAAGLPETDSQHFASAYEYEEIWAKDRAECAAKQAAREAKAARRWAARLAKAGGGMGAGGLAQEDDRIELQGDEQEELDADDNAEDEDDVEDDVEDEAEEDGMDVHVGLEVAPDAASLGVSDQDAHDGGDGYDLFCTATGTKPPSKRQRS